MKVRIADIDPQGTAALSLLREAAIDVRPLYASSSADAPWPTNAALGPRDIYVAAFLDEAPVACGSIRELDRMTAEIRRMYVHRDHRRKRLGAMILSHLQSEARRLGYHCLRLETGNRQAAAMALYEAAGFRRIEPFGKYASDPTSICYERIINDGPGT